MADPRRIRVVYADDNPKYRTQLLRALLGDPGFEVVAVAVDGQAAMDAIALHRPDVALIGVRTPGLAGLAVAEEVAGHVPALPTRVLLLAALPVASTSRVMQAVGLRGVVDRASSQTEIRAALAAAAP